MRDDVYGWRHGDLARAAQQVSRALGVQLELRMSSFQAGDYYTWAGDGDAEIIVQYNSRDEDGLFEVPAFPAHSVLLYARCLPEHALEVLGQLDGIELLQSRSIPDLEF